MDCGFDEEIWDRLARIVRAAHEMDRDVFLARAQSFADEVGLPGQQRAGLYLWYLLRNALGGKVGGRVPTDAELARISHDYFARFSALADADRRTLEDTFRKVFERAPVKKEISPGGLLVLAPAALGVLYEDLDAELASMSQALRAWLLSAVVPVFDRGVRLLAAGRQARLPGMPGSAPAPTVPDSPPFVLTG